MIQLRSKSYRSIVAVALAAAAAAAVAATSAAVAADGDSEPMQPTGVTTPAAVGTSAAGVDPRSGGLQVALGEWSIGLEAKAIRPGPVTFVVTNRGKFRHGFEIQAAGEHHGRDDDDEELETDRLEPGESARLTLDLEPGVYEVECFVSHHDERGMVARLVVRADAPLVTVPTAQANTVAITNFAFQPALLRVKAGATVRWRNRDTAQHTATAFDRAFDSKLLVRNAGYARKFSRPGTYAYLCALHPQMTGKVIVR
jgi:plastocyanin